MDHTLQEWVRLAQDSDLAQAAIDAQAHETRRTSTEVFETMRSYWHNMQEAIQEGLQPNLRSVSGLSGGQAVKLLERIKRFPEICWAKQRLMRWPLQSATPVWARLLRLQLRGRAAFCLGCCKQCRKSEAYKRTIWCGHSSLLRQ